MLPESPYRRTIDWLFSLDERRLRDPHAGDAGGRRYRMPTFRPAFRLGLIRVAAPFGATHLQSGALVARLEQAASGSSPLSLVYPQNRHLPPAVKRVLRLEQACAATPHSEA
ncbi:hypothetical protein MJ561_13230 [Klebsiella pneumoniae]|nr:hypothetical protein MJ561_13230 [Klebsiella pneumoniae]